MPDFGYDWGDYVNRLWGIESGWDPNNRTGSNRGLSQFGPVEEARYGINDSNRNDPGTQERALRLETERNTPLLRRALGRDPLPWEYYFTHQQGEAGGPALLSASPNVPAWQVIRPFYKSDAIAKQAITGNVSGDLKGLSADQITAGMFTNFWENKWDSRSGKTGNIQAPQAVATPEGAIESQGYQAGTGQMPSASDAYTAGGLLGPPQQQVQGGLLGALRDPQAMAYLAMIGKGLNPYSSLDPDAMLKLAQASEQNAQANAIRQQQLAIDQGRFGLEQRKYEDVRGDLAREEQASREFWQRMGGQGQQPTAGSETF